MVRYNGEEYMPLKTTGTEIKITNGQNAFWISQSDVEKTLIINLIGASGSGKTTIAKELEEIGYNIIQSYTTRPPREDGEWGHTFIGDCFVSYNPNNSVHYLSEGLSANSNTYWAKDMIAYFNSYNSGHHYFATDEQVIRGKTNIYIVDPKGAEQVRDFYKESDVKAITIYLQVDWIERRGRLMSRGDAYRETMVRLRKDDKLFKTVKCDYVIDGNQDIETVVDSVKNILV